MKFRDKLLRQYERAIANSTSFEELLGKMRGAHPVEVMALDVTLPPASGLRSTRPYSMESNPAYMQWSFTQYTRSLLAGLLDPNWERMAFLGCPSVFSLFEDDSRAYLFDIDQRYYINERTVICDFADFDFSDYESSFDFVLFDPPWYVGNFLNWSKIAHGLSTRGATVMFPLFQELLRPSAQQERRRILVSWRKAMKHVVRLGSRVAYEMPHFEEEQIRHNGIELGDWRVADLVIAQKTLHDCSGIFLTKEGDRFVDTGNWLTFHHEGKTISVCRNNGGNCDDATLFPLGDCGLLSSPSLRTPERRRANVLFSDGRAAVSQNVDLLIARLTGGDFSDIRTFERMTASCLR